MDFVTLAPGDTVEINLDGRTFTGVVRYVIQTSDRDFRVTMEPGEGEHSIKFMRVVRKLICYMGF